MTSFYVEFALVRPTPSNHKLMISIGRTIVSKRKEGGNKPTGVRSKSNEFESEGREKNNQLTYFFTCRRKCEEE